MGNFKTSCQCGNGTMCANFSNNLISTYYMYWLSKVEIEEDDGYNLKQIFDSLNMFRMRRGITALILNYGRGLTIADFVDIKYDKNFIPIGGNVNINLNTSSNVSGQMINTLNNGTNIRVLDWKLFKKENAVVLRQILDDIGLTEAEILNQDESKWLTVKSSIPVFKTIIFRNNISDEPSLLHLNKILYNIHDLDNINDRNHKLINAIYFAKTGKKLTPEQAQNISITVSRDGYGIMITEDGEELNLTGAVNKQVIAQSLSNWSEIKDEIEIWEDKFQKYSGMPSEKLSNQRENLGESFMRMARVNATEKTYYKHIKMLFDEYDEFFAIQKDNYKPLIYQFDSLITDTIGQNRNLQNINTTTNENKFLGADDDDDTN